MQKISDKLNEIEQQLADNDIYSEQNRQKLQQLLQEKAALDKTHENAESEWFETSEQLENIS